MGELKIVNLSDIRENPVALRTVDLAGEQYLGIVDSIRVRGFMGAITVRSQKDPNTNATFYEIVDGLHRTTAARAAGLTQINVDVVDLTQDQMLEAQILTNIHKVETKPVEYSQQLKRILVRNPLMTESELATKICKSPSWVKERLGLAKITNPEIASAINEGKIGLANAYSLAKLPDSEQPMFMDRAITTSPEEFIPAVNARCKELREAKRKGQAPADVTFQPVAFLQKLGDIKDSLTNTVPSTVCAMAGAVTAVDGFNAAIKWVLHLDTASIAEQIAKHEARELEKDEAKKRREAEKADRKVKAAASAAVDAGA